MRSKIVPIGNVTRLKDAAHMLLNRAYGMPGMGLVEGRTGYGKSTAAAWLINQINGVYVRAIAADSAASVLERVARELDLEVRGSNAAKIDAIVRKLAVSRRPLFLDEADYIADQKRLTETLRDIHDLSTVPVILIGHAGIRRKLESREQLTGRIAQIVTFGAMTDRDADLVAGALCEVAISREMVTLINRETAGEVRRFVVALANIEKIARDKGLAVVNAGDIKLDNLFIAAPTAQRARAMPLGTEAAETSDAA